MIYLPDLDDTATDQATLQILINLLIYLKPRTIVEAGTWKGHFSVTAAEHLPNSRIFTADIVDQVPEKPKNLYHFIGDFSQMLDKIDSKIDFAYLDSGPPFLLEEDLETDIRYRHYKAVKPYMAGGGLIVNHDMNARDWIGANEIAADADVYLPGGRGITIKQID